MGVIEKDELLNGDEENRKRLKSAKIHERVVYVQPIPATLSPPPGNGKGKERANWTWPQKSFLNVLD